MRRCVLLFLPFFAFGSVLAADERLASRGVSLYFSCINPIPVVNYDCFTLGDCLRFLCLILFFFFLIHSWYLFFFHQLLPSSLDVVPACTSNCSFISIFSSNYKASYLCLSVCMFVCMYVLHISQEPFTRSTSHLAGEVLRTQRSAVLYLVQFRHALINFE